MVGIYAFGLEFKIVGWNLMLLLKWNYAFWLEFQVVGWNLNFFVWISLKFVVGTTTIN